VGLLKRSADDGGSPARAAGGDGNRGVSHLRWLKLIGVVLPVLFILALEVIRLAVIEGSAAEYGMHVVLAGVTVAAVIAFSFVMFHLIERAQDETAEVVADLRRRQREGHGFYDVLLRISNQEPLAEILAAVARHARELLGGDAATVCLNDATTRSVRVDQAHSGPDAPHEGVCVLPDANGSYTLHELRDIHGIRPPSEFKESLQVDIQSRDTVLGELWIGRRSTDPFSDRDGHFLSTLSDLTSIAVTGARMREAEQQGAILAERERIARELHDSLAQVLGAMHLRLRALDSHEELGTAAAVVEELNQLADICEEGYRDARGAILDLHESSRTDRSLIEGLRAYLDKYSRQCGIGTSLEAEVDQELALPPRSEIQIIRVVQEALTNVRKHSGANAAIVRVAQDNGTVTFIVEDDGRGFDLTEELLDRDGFGLHSMRERMELIGGTLLTDSEVGRGTRIVAALPNVPARASAAAT